MPVAQAMGYVAGGSFAGAPRFVMFFKGGFVSLADDQPDHFDDAACRARRSRRSRRTRRTSSCSRA